MTRQQRRQQWSWVWVVCLGFLGVTLAGCDSSSSTSENSQSTTIRVIFPQEARLWEQDLPDATAASPDRLPARVMRQAGNLVPFLEVSEAQAQAFPSSIAALILHVTDTSGTPFPGLENVDIPLSTGRVTVPVPLGPDRVFIVETFLACPGSVQARNFTGKQRADVPPAGTTVTIMMQATDEVVVASPGNQSSNEGKAVTVPIRASASHCMPLTFIPGNLPPGLSMDPSTGVITGTPAPEAAGTYIVTITASDGTHSSTTTFTWRIGIVVPQFPLMVTKGGMGSGTVTSTPAGIDCGPTCSTQTMPFDQGTSVTLTPTPVPGSTFDSWGGDCASAGTVPTCTVSMTQARNVTATFTPIPESLTVTLAGSGTVTSSPAGISCSSNPCSATFAFGTSVTLTATPATGSSFTGWTGEGCSGTGTCTVSMTQARTVTATFMPPPPGLLTVTLAGTGSGTVTSSPAGISCSSNPCSATFAFGTSVTLTATPAPGSSFTGWTGEGCSGTGTCTVSMTQARTVTATFTRDTGNLQLSKSLTGGPSGFTGPFTIAFSCNDTPAHTGSVTVAAGGSPQTIRDIPTGTQCTVSETPPSPPTGFTFGSPTFSPANTVTIAPKDATVTVTTNNTLAINPTVTVQGAGSGSGTVTGGSITCTRTAGTTSGTCTQLVNFGDSLTLSATPATGSTFTGWSGACTNTTGPCSLTNITANQTVTATFNLTPQFTLTVSKTAFSGLVDCCGTVASTPPGISCGPTCIDQTARFDTNTQAQVTLTAFADSGPISETMFTGWTGDVPVECLRMPPMPPPSTCIVNMTQAGSVSVGASFSNTFNELPSLILTKDKAGSGSGTVTSSPPGISCGPTCTDQAVHFPGDTTLLTQVTLTATAASGSSFTGWTGEGCSGIGTCVVSMTLARHSVTATFSFVGFFGLSTSAPFSALSSQPSSVLSVLVTGTNVVLYVPKGHWSSEVKNVAVVNVEGSSITPQQITTPNVVNSCASNFLTGQTVCTANTTDVYVISGTTLTSTLTSAGSGSIFFPGGFCTNCRVAMDATHNKAVIALSLSGGVGGYQYLDLGVSPAFEPAFASPAPSGDFANISEGILIDPIHNLLLSPNENGNFEIVSVATTTSPAFFENAVSGALPFGAAGEDYTTGIALVPFGFSEPSNVYIADLTQATFTPGSPSMWSAPSQVQTLSESSLSGGASDIAVAQGTYTGIVTGKFGGDTITAIALPTTSGSGTPALNDWVTCSIPGGFSTGAEPHTVNAYQSPNGGHAIGLVVNGGATTLAVVDLTMMLNPTIVPRTVDGHACAAGTLPATVVSTITVP